MKRFMLILLLVLFLSQDAHSYNIAIDIGHTDEHPGAISAAGVPEITYNKRVANSLKDYIEEKGKHSTFFIENMGLRERVDIANRWADIFVSIHHDSVSKNLVPFAYKFRGFSLFVSDRNPRYKESLMLAKLIGSKLIRNDFYVAMHHEQNRTRRYVSVDKEKGIYKGNVLTVIKETTVPAVLVECGIIKNAYEEAWLELPENHYNLIASIGDSIEEYFERWHNRPDYVEPKIVKTSDVKEKKKVLKKNANKEGLRNK